MGEGAAWLDDGLSRPTAARGAPTFLIVGWDDGVEPGRHRQRVSAARDPRLGGLPLGARVMVTDTHAGEHLNHAPPQDGNGVVLDRGYNQVGMWIGPADRGMSPIVCYNPHGLNLPRLRERARSMSLGPSGR